MVAQERHPLCTPATKQHKNKKTKTKNKNKKRRRDTSLHPGTVLRV